MVAKQSKQRLNNVFPWIIGASTVILVSGYFRTLTIKASIYGDYEFRQSQTAWPVKFWLENGFDAFKPVVPVRGSSQVWLLEFPLFQWISYYICQLFNMSADHGVKILGFICSVLIGLLIGRIVAKSAGEIYGLLAVALYLFSPFSLWWGSTGLIDSLATLFAVACLYIFLNRETAKFWLFFEFLFLMLAALVKPNVAIMYAGTIFLFEAIRIRKFPVLKSIFLTLAIVPVTFLWSAFSMSGISENDPRIIWYPTSSMRYWFFGTTEQYLAAPLSLIEIFARTFQAIGTSEIMVLILLVATLSSKYWRLSLASIFGITVSWGIFINLNIVHSYYQIPAVPLLVIVATFGISALIEKVNLNKVQSRTLLTCIPLAALLLSATEPGFGNSYWQKIRNPMDSNSSFSDEISKNTQPGTLIVVTGYSNDPTVLYEANRYGYMFDDSAGMYDNELKFLSMQDPSLYCSLARGESTSEDHLNEILSLFPEATQISNHIYSWC